jgi:hypothetical protein
MSELSVEAYMDKLEHRFDRQKRLRSFLLEVAISAAMIASPSTAHIAFEEIHKNDALPHD